MLTAWTVHREISTGSCIELQQIALTCNLHMQSWRQSCAEGLQTYTQQLAVQQRTKAPEPQTQTIQVYELQQASDIGTDSCTSSRCVSSAAEQAQAESWSDGADQQTGAYMDEGNEAEGLELNLDAEYDGD